MNISRISDEKLMAFVDGELDAAGVAAVEEAMRADPEVASAVAAALALRERVGRAYASVLEEPVPAHLLAAAGAVPSGGARLRSRYSRTLSASGRRWPQWAALAASLALGVLIAPWLRPGAPVMLHASDDSLRARGELARALESRLASDPSAAGQVSVGLSFRATDGDYCRTFVLAPTQAIAGLACRDAEGWRVTALGEAGIEAGQLRLASSSLPPAVLAEVDARLEGDVLDAQGERVARSAGWR